MSLRSLNMQHGFNCVRMTAPRTITDQLCAGQTFKREGTVVNGHGKTTRGQGKAVERQVKFKERQ